MEKGKKGGCQNSWPLFYMNDFSQLGLVVAPFEKALEVLSAQGFFVHQEEGATLVEISDQGQLSKIMQTLSNEKLDFEMSDLVSCVYQG
nr:hypothetical protein [uncultured Desulfobulbus sp.]